MSRIPKYDTYAMRATIIARKHAMAVGNSFVCTEHLLLGLIENSEYICFKILESLRVPMDALKHQLTEAAQQTDSALRSGDQPVLSPTCKEAAYLAEKSAEEAICPEDLLVGVMQTTGDSGKDILADYGITNTKLIKQRALELKRLAGEDMNPEKKQAPPQSELPGVLKDCAVDLTQKARNGELDPLIGRTEAIRRMSSILMRRTKRNPLLLGEEGVGKTAVVEGFAQAIADGDVPQSLLDKRVVSVDMGLFLAGTPPGQFEKRFKALLNDAIQARNIILFFDEFHALIGMTGYGGSVDANTMLKPPMARGELQIIAATTINDKRKVEKKDTSLWRRFGNDDIQPNTVAETEAIIKGTRWKYESYHYVTLTDEIIKLAIEQVNRYRQDGFMPDKAIDVIDEACAEVSKRATSAPAEVATLRAEINQLNAEEVSLLQKRQTAEARKIAESRRVKLSRLTTLRNESALAEHQADQPPAVQSEDVFAVVSRITNIPINRLSEDESEKLLNLEANLHNRVVAQEPAIIKLANAVRRGRTGVKNPKRPVGSFLFLGPTGVGKTEVARALAEFLFGTEDALIRLDMSEYAEKHNVARMIGSPPGYIGHEEGGQLTEKIRRRPYCVVLLDEIEKAHQDVWNILLQVLEDGRLTDGQGNQVDCRNAVFIMTSNIGARAITDGAANVFASSSVEKLSPEEIERQHRRVEEQVKAEVKLRINPELLNRIDDSVIFHKLEREHVWQIINLLAGNLKRAAQDYGFTIEITDEAKNWLMDNGGYDKKYGARPMRRKIVDTLENELSVAILRKQFKKGDVLKAVVRDNKLVLEAVEALQ